MQQIALDTNIAIDLLNGNQDLLERLGTFDLLCLPVTVCGELLFGALNSGRPEENLQRFKAFIDACEVLNSNVVVAEEYSIIRKALKEIGRPIPENDIWIAAICQVNEIPLLTKDKHFSHIEGMVLIDL